MDLRTVEQADALNEILADNGLTLTGVLNIAIPIPISSGVPLNAVTELRTFLPREVQPDQVEVSAMTAAVRPISVPTTAKRPKKPSFRL